MVKIENSIQIDASAAIVWEVTTDVERWPEWLPTFSEVTGVSGSEVRPGAIFRIRQPAQPIAEWTVTELVAGQRFVWKSSRRGLNLEASHEVVPDGEAAVSILKVRASGVLSILMWPLLRPAVALALGRENRGLKVRCESIAASAREQGGLFRQQESERLPRV